MEGSDLGLRFERRNRPRTEEVLAGGAKRQRSSQRRGRLRELRGPGGVRGIDKRVFIGFCLLHVSAIIHLLPYRCT